MFLLIYSLWWIHWCGSRRGQRKGTSRLFGSPHYALISMTLQRNWGLLGIPAKEWYVCRLRAYVYPHRLGLKMSSGRSSSSASRTAPSVSRLRSSELFRTWLFYWMNSSWCIPRSTRLYSAFSAIASATTSKSS